MRRGALLSAGKFSPQQAIVQCAGGRLPNKLAIDKMIKLCYISQVSTISQASIKVLFRTLTSQKIVGQTV
jgi:hypothetical protein